MSKEISVNPIKFIIILSIILISAIISTILTKPLMAKNTPAIIVIFKEPIKLSENNTIDNIKVLNYRTYDGFARLWISDDEIWDIPYPNIKAILPLKSTNLNPTSEQTKTMNLLK